MSPLKSRNPLEKSSFFFSFGRKLFPWFLIFELWALIILPSAYQPQWAYLDVPYVLRVICLAPISSFFTPDQVSGRFFPLFSVFYALQFKMWGYYLQGYYLFQAILFMILLGLLYGLVKKVTHSILIALIAVLLVSTASPVAENFYTICKQDPLALFFMALLIFLCHCYLETGSIAHKVRKWFLLGSIGCAAFVALLTKETTVVFLVFPISGSILSYLFFKRKFLSDKRLFHSFVWMTIFVGGALGAVRLLYSALKPANSSQIYVSYPINKDLIFTNLEFYLKQQPDVILIGIAALFILVFLFFRGKTFPHEFIFFSALFLTGTAYFVGHLFWRWPLGYYLLIPSALWGTAFAVSFGFLPPSRVGKALLYTGLALIIMTRIYSLSYFYYIARAQKTQDQIYTAAIEDYLRLADNGEHLFFEQWSFYEEGVQQSNILVREILHRPKLKVKGVHDLLEGRPVSQEILRLYGVSSGEGETRVPREKDFILIFTGKGQSSWVLRGVAPFPDQEKSEYQIRGISIDFRTEKEARWTYLNAAAPFRSLNFQEYSKGYRLYQVKDPTTLMSWNGRWQDGWIGQQARLSLNLKNPKEELQFEGVVPPFAVPNSLTIRQGGRVLKKIDLRESGSFSFSLGLDSSPDNPAAELELVAEKTFIPKEIGLNSDTRILSLQISAVRKRL